MRERVPPKAQTPFPFTPAQPRLARHSFTLKTVPKKTTSQAQPDLQTQLEKAERIGHNFANIPIFAPGTQPLSPPVVQPKLSIGQLSVLDEQETAPSSSLSTSAQSAENREDSSPLVQRQFIEEKNEEQTGTIQRWGDPDNAASTPVEESTPADPQRPLAEKIINDLQQGGITVAAYAARNVSQAGEFQRQATRFALDHGALGIRRNEVTEGLAMELTESLSSLLQSLTVKISTLLARFPDLVGYQSLPVNIRTLAIFTHGGTSSLQAGSNGQWIRSSLAPWVESLTPYLSPSPRVLLYACNAAGTPSSGVPFAQALQQMLQDSLERRYGSDAEAAPEVWGHEDKGHTTANNRLVRFGGEAESSGGENFLDQLGQRLVARAMVQTGYAVSTNEEWERLSRKGRRVMQRVMRASTGSMDSTNAYIREVPQMGIERVWADLTTPSTPNFSDIGLSADAVERVAAGLTTFRKRFEPATAEFERQLRSSSRD